MTQVTQIQDAAKKPPFEKLRDEVIANDNILGVSMSRLRNAAGYGRLGKYVVQEIDDKLRGRGLGHTKLSADNQEEMVYVYVMGSGVERIIEAANHPSKEGADAIRLATDQNSTDVLRQVKALLEGV